MSTIYGPYKRKSDGRWIILIDGKTISYPRYVYEKYHKVILDDMHDVDHKDDDPNNNHIDNLQLLTRKENNIKMQKLYAPTKYGPQSEDHKRSGTKNGMTKFTDQDIKEIRATPIIWGHTIPRLMKKYNVSRRTIQNILHNTSFK